MKRNFILFMLSFLAIMNSYGQIEREYMGFKIGSSTKNEVFKKIESGQIESEEIEIISKEDNRIFIETVTELLSGRWEMVNYEFQDNLLQSITFLISDKNNGLINALLVQQKCDVEKELMDKYAQYFSQKASKDDFKLYVDPKTIIFFQAITKDSHYFLKLEIIDRDFYLARKKKQVR